MGDNDYQHQHPEQSDRELLIRIDERVNAIKQSLEQGHKTMNDHEIRLGTQEIYTSGLMTKSSCSELHKSLARQYVGLLLVLLTAAIGVIAVLIEYRP